MLELQNTPLVDLIEKAPRLSLFLKKHYGEIKLNNLSINELIEKYFSAGYARENESKEFCIEKFHSFYHHQAEIHSNLQSGIKHLTIKEGSDKSQIQHGYTLDLLKGCLTAVVGPTSSGKSSLLDDIENLVCGSSHTNRKILVDGNNVSSFSAKDISQIVTRVSVSYTKCQQGSVTVSDFIYKHLPANFNDHRAIMYQIIEMANMLVEESIEQTTLLDDISERQMKALLIADIAATDQSPILLFDELENFGIDKYRALKLLTSSSRIIILATHDPLLILMCMNRIVMKNGAICQIVDTTEKEKALMQELIQTEKRHSAYRESFRNGEIILL